MPDIQKTLDDYTQYHAEKYAKYLFDEMHSQMAKQISNGIQFDFGFIPTVIKGYKYSSYKDWKASDNRSVNQVATLLGGPRIHRDSVVEPRVTKADNSKAKSILNWIPTQDFEKWVVSWKVDLGLNFNGTSKDTNINPSFGESQKMKL